MANVLVIAELAGGSARKTTNNKTRHPAMRLHEIGHNGGRNHGSKDSQGYRQSCPAFVRRQQLAGQAANNEMYRQLRAQNSLSNRQYPNILFCPFVIVAFR